MSQQQGTRASSAATLCPLSPHRTVHTSIQPAVQLSRTGTKTAGQKESLPYKQQQQQQQPNQPTIPTYHYHHNTIPTNNNETILSESSQLTQRSSTGSRGRQIAETIDSSLRPSPTAPTHLISISPRRLSISLTVKQREARISSSLRTNPHRPARIIQSSPSLCELLHYSADSRFLPHSGPLHRLLCSSAPVMQACLSPSPLAVR